MYPLPGAPQTQGSVHGLGYLFKELVRGETILVKDPPLESGRFVWLVTTSHIGGHHILTVTKVSVTPFTARQKVNAFLLDKAGTGLLSGSHGKEAFFIDSWKFRTRNPHKLFLALEYVPASGGKIVTHSAYLENGTVSCRQGFLRPAHVDGEILAKFSRRDQGTTMVHRRELEKIAGR